MGWAEPAGVRREVSIVENEVGRRLHVAPCLLFVAGSDATGQLYRLTTFKTIKVYNLVRVLLENALCHVLNYKNVTENIRKILVQTVKIL